MFIPSLRRKTAVLLLTASLATPLAASAASTPLEALSRAWGLLASLWSGAGGPPAGWWSKQAAGSHIDPAVCIKPAAETGCNTDPDGRCVKPAAVVQVDTGCHIDPSGSCVKPAAVAPADTGCHIDPNGSCRQ